jgi:hypothetical protein
MSAGFGECPAARVGARLRFGRAVDFLTDDQAEAHGKFAEEPVRLELERFFCPDDVDRALIGARREDQNRLGLALQTCTVRYDGLSLEDPLAVPRSVIEALGHELGFDTEE